MTRLVSRPDPTSPGLFVNPDWVEGTPGTFAVVIGVSSYHFLEGGRSYQGDESYGLGQLHVSAATSHRFFSWLQEEYDFEEAQAAKCWLLLSPTATELNSLNAGSIEQLGAAEATLSNCETAIGWWNVEMRKLPRAAAKKSRSLFFFSGHGLEVWQEQQILLPCDYLRPPLGNVNDAISTANLRKGLASSPVPNHFLFVDACRNDVEQLRQFGVEGRETLNVRNSASTNPDSLFGTLYAAASGTQTWQPRELAQGYSIFGGAVIDGLRGATGVELQRCVHNRCEVWFYPLESFVKAHMATALRQFRSPEKVRVRNGGTPPDGGITSVSVSAVPDMNPDDPLGGIPDSTHDMALEDALEGRYNVHLGNLRWNPSLRNPQVFGSYPMTHIWRNTIFASNLRTGLRVAPTEISVRSVDRSSDGEAFRITIELPFDRGGHWLQFADIGGHAFACVLPGDAHVPPIYELEIDFDKRQDQSEPALVARFEAGLSLQNRGPVADAARIWAIYQARNVQVAASEIHLLRLERVLMGKESSPLAASVAGLVLLRARRFDLLHETWLRNLRDRFPEVPDGAVLFALQELTERRNSVIGRLRRLDAQLTLPRQLKAHGLPRLAELLPLAGRQLAELSSPRFRRELREMGQLNSARDMEEAIDLALKHHRPGGLFSVFSGPPTELGPHLVQGTARGE